MVAQDAFIIFYLALNNMLEHVSSLLADVGSGDVHFTELFSSMLEARMTHWPKWLWLMIAMLAMFATMASGKSLR